MCVCALAESWWQTILLPTQVPTAVGTG
eukprot:SAG11_NODE_23236_length_392_cov_1.511945_1_plen_27_part_01